MKEKNINNIDEYMRFANTIQPIHNPMTEDLRLEDEREEMIKRANIRKNNKLPQFGSTKEDFMINLREEENYKKSGINKLADNNQHKDINDFRSKEEGVKKSSMQNLSNNQAREDLREKFNKKTDINDLMNEQTKNKQLNNKNNNSLYNSNDNHFNNKNGNNDHFKNNNNDEVSKMIKSNQNSQNADNFYFNSNNIASTSSYVRAGVNKNEEYLRKTYNFYGEFNEKFNVFLNIFIFFNLLLRKKINKG